MKQLKMWQADILLILLTVWWGVSYVSIDYCLNYVDTFTLNSIRFMIGGLVVLPFCYKRIKLCINKKSIKWGMWIGFWMFLTYVCVTYGVKNTSITNSGFLAGLCVVFTPVINAIYTGHFPARKTLISIILSFIGISLLTLGEGFSINTSTIKGDILCVACSIAYAIQIVITDKILRANPVKDGEFDIKSPDYVDPLCIGLVSIFAVGLMNLCLSVCMFDVELPENPKFYVVSLFLAIFCTGIAFIIQPLAQQFTSANRVGIILALEPVFNAIIAIIYIGEILMTRKYFGGALMLLSVILLEVDFRQLFLKS